jgi:hypothetical protein
MAAEELLLAGFPLGLLAEEFLVICAASAVGAALTARGTWERREAEELWTVAGLCIGMALPQLRLQALYGERLRQAARDLPGRWT